MELDGIIKIVEVLVIPILAWIIREISSLKKEFFEFKAEVERDFSRKEEFIRLEDKIDNLTQLIMDRLPKKAGR
jgi:predicted transglutaminase-like protease